MSAKAAFAILLIAFILSAIGLTASLKKNAITIPDFTSNIQKLLDIKLPNNPTIPTASPSALPNTTNSLQPTPIATPTNPNSRFNIDTNTSINSRSCYKVTINGKVYEKCTEDGNLEFNYPD